MTTQRFAPPAQEQDRVDGPRVSLVAVVGVAITALSVAVVRSMLERPAAAHARPGVLRLEQGPIETTAPGSELRERKALELSRYAWVDREQGVVAIPIERAMELVVSQRGAP